MKKTAFFAALALISSGGISAQHHGLSPHAGKQHRQIASLSDQDMAAIRQGTGWGLALPAEINGAPGPRHVLDLAEPLALSDEQVKEITAIFNEMKQGAIARGEAFVAAEKALNDAFIDGGLDQAELERLVQEAGLARAQLRLVHLAAHLKTTPLLSKQQIERYAELRGYAHGTVDPCASVPEGHDAEMWKKHNGCE